jgi:hypothetical protein
MREDFESVDESELVGVGLIDSSYLEHTGRADANTVAFGFAATVVPVRVSNHELFILRITATTSRLRRV